MLNHKVYWVLISWILLGFIPNLAISQSMNCTQRLKEANDLYDQGRLVEVIRKLKEGDCLEEGFTKEERTRVYKLMALVYIFMDDEVNAEESVISLLTVDPEHPLDENEPAEFVYMYNKYRSKPIFRLGVYLGGNLTSANSLARYSTFSTTLTGEDAITKEFDSDLGFQGGISIEYMPIENLETILRFQYSMQSYTIGYPIITNNPEDDASDFKVEALRETQSWVSIPIGIRYSFPVGKYKPYVIGGGTFHYLLSAKMTGERQGTTTRSVSDLDLKAFDLRNQFNWSYFGGVGVKIDVKRTNSIFIEATYNIGGQNIVNGENRYDSQELNYNLAHTDDDKSINHIALSIGWIKSIYNPKRYSDKKLEKNAKQKKKKNDK